MRCLGTIPWMMWPSQAECRHPQLLCVLQDRITGAKLHAVTFLTVAPFIIRLKYLMLQSTFLSFCGFEDRRKGHAPI